MPTTSLDRLRGMIEELQDADDEQLAAAVPMASPMMIRGLLPVISYMLPDTPEGLEEFLEQAEMMIRWIRAGAGDE